MTAERQAADPRKPAWDAVFAYIRTLPREGDRPDVVERNAMIWRGVNAALVALGYPDADTQEAAPERQAACSNCEDIDPASCVYCRHQAPEQQAAPVQPDLRQRIAQALSAAGAFCGECGFEPGETGCPDCVRVRQMYTSAVLAVVEPELAKRQERGDIWKAKAAELEQDRDRLDTALAALREQLAEAQTENARLTTALEVVTRQHAEAVTARNKARTSAKISDDIQRAEKRLFDTAIRDLGGNPVEVQNLYAQLSLRATQWKDAQQQAEQLRQQLNALGPRTWRARWESTVVEARRQARRADELEQQAKNSARNTMRLGEDIVRLRKKLAARPACACYPHPADHEDDCPAVTRPTT
ncbi:hypothetical protein [Kitasatospora phosalacinea]|uniref:Uncharacterized protein n=1 Tax=Kitasatospora phosalacinea TaxID=2065 RepID=A0ABW6GRC6_9ACTN